MSSKYKHGDTVPNDVLANRLDELANLVTKGSKERLLSEMTMRVPAELDRDADLVLSEAARRLRAIPTTAEPTDEQIECPECKARFYPEHAVAQMYLKEFNGRSTAATEEAANYAARLATSIWEQHYRNESPEWQVCDELMSILSQIDNMLTGLKRDPDYLVEYAPNMFRRMSDRELAAEVYRAMHSAALSQQEGK